MSALSAEEEKTEMGRFSKNFLPILFNVYSLQPADGESGTYRMAVLDTIKVYLSVTEMQVCTIFFSLLLCCSIFIKLHAVATILNILKYSSH